MEKKITKIKTNRRLTKSASPLPSSRSYISFDAALSIPPEKSIMAEHLFPKKSKKDNLMFNTNTKSKVSLLLVMDLI